MNGRPSGAGERGGGAVGGRQVETSDCARLTADIIHCSPSAQNSPSFWSKTKT